MPGRVRAKGSLTHIDRISDMLWQGVRSTLRRANPAVCHVLGLSRTGGNVHFVARTGYFHSRVGARVSSGDVEEVYGVNDVEGSSESVTNGGGTHWGGGGVRTLGVCLVGLPNAGKSTLVNKLLRNKLSAVSPKRNTTQSSMLGILEYKEGGGCNKSQVAFWDTPGFISRRLKGNDYKRELYVASSDAISDSSIALVVIDAVRRLDESAKQDLNDLLVKALYCGCRLVVVLNKVDLVRYKPDLLIKTDEVLVMVKDAKEDVDKKILKQKENNSDEEWSMKTVNYMTGEQKDEQIDLLDELNLDSSGEKVLENGGMVPLKVFLISAKSGNGVDDVRNYLMEMSASVMDEMELGAEGWGECIDDELDLRVTEAIREQVFRRLHREVPYRVSIGHSVATGRTEVSEFENVLHVGTRAHLRLVKAAIPRMQRCAEADLYRSVGRPIRLLLRAKLSHKLALVQ